MSMGGDTDTNAANVGGLVSALHGDSCVPECMKPPLVARDSNSPGRKRPDFLRSKALPGLRQQLFQLAGGSS